MKLLTILSFALVIIGGVNWGLVGLFQFDLVATIFGGGATTGARIVYILVGLAALYCVPLFKFVCESNAARIAVTPPHNGV